MKSRGGYLRYKAGEDCHKEASVMLLLLSMCVCIISSVFVFLSVNANDFRSLERVSAYNSALCSMCSFSIHTYISVQN